MSTSQSSPSSNGLRSRPVAAATRHAKGYRTARENLDDPCDRESFIEYGQLAVAAHLEIDAVIEPSETGRHVSLALAAAA
jgi:acetyl-CoA carboxylase carboxyltransferase component